MTAVFIILIVAVVAFMMWSKGGAKAARQRYLEAHNNALAQRLSGGRSHPSWWNEQDEAMLSTVLGMIRPQLLKSGFSPAAIQLWLDADETIEDFLTFLAHAEKVGFKQSEQIALLPDFALAALNVDLFNEHTQQDKNVYLYVVAGTKASNQQTFVKIDDLSPRVVENYLAQRGATLDEDVPEEHQYYEYEYGFRSLRHTLIMDIGSDRAELVIHDKFSYTPLTTL